MKDAIAFLDDCPNTFVFTGNNVRPFIAYLSAAGLVLCRLENFMADDGSVGFFIESQSPVSRQKAEALIRSFRSS